MQSTSDALFQSNSLPPVDATTSQTKTAESSTLREKICYVISIVLTALAATVFFMLNPSLFLASCLIGIVWSENVAKGIDKIVAVWKRQPWIVSAAIVMAGVLALPAALAAGSILFAAHLGSQA